jgi:hypothetical protein
VVVVRNAPAASAPRTPLIDEYDGFEYGGKPVKRVVIMLRPNEFRSASCRPYVKTDPGVASEF